jgi:hypothetical protein
MSATPITWRDPSLRGKLLLPLPLLLALALLFTSAAACGSKTSTTSSGSSSSTTSSSGSSQTGSSPSGGATPTSCASVGSKKIPKTRVLADLGISAGAFHRYIYKPIKSGSFTGATKTKKVVTLVKGAVAAGAIAHFLGNAIDNARSDATLCKYVPNMTQIKTKLTAMGSQLRGGNTSQVDSTNSSFTDLQKQTGFTPDDNATVPGVS